MSKSNEVFFTGRRKVWINFLGILLLGMFFGGILYPKLPGGVPLSAWFNKFSPKLGLDLQGGAHLVYQADVSEIPFEERAGAVEGVRDVIERRVNALGVSEPLVQTNHDGDNYRIIVELAGVFDVNEAIKQIGETPLLEFKESNPNASQVQVLTDEQQKQIEESEKNALSKAKNIIERLNKGEDFAEIAKSESEDPGSKENGGDLGFAPRGMFVPEFEQALFDELKDGEITKEPIKTQFGYHVIQRIESRTVDRDGVQTEEVRGRHILIMTLSENDFLNEDDIWLNTELSGRHLKRAQVTFDQNTGSPQVAIAFNDEGKDLFAEITERNLQKPVAIFLDGELISAPVVQQVISAGEAVISGNFSITEAKLLAQRLNAGALPVPITLISQLKIGPSLGSVSIEKSISAGLWGLIAVMIFMLIVYRLPGLLADIALVIYAVMVFGLFELIPVTLTLAGITGFILSVGMAVDANILIFERMKEELSLGKPILAAIEEGFRRAWTSIRDSNVSSLITAAILIWFGTSIIKGFALTLSIGILVSMFSAITVTRTLLRLVAGSKLGEYTALFGVSKKSFKSKD